MIMKHLMYPNKSVKYNFLKRLIKTQTFAVVVCIVNSQ